MGKQNIGLNSESHQVSEGFEMFSHAIARKRESNDRGIKKARSGSKEERRRGLGARLIREGRSRN